MSLLSRIDPARAASLPKRPEPPEPVVDTRPTWVKLAAEKRLPARVEGGAAA